jgi:hypothetical protein
VRRVKPSSASRSGVVFEVNAQEAAMLLSFEGVPVDPDLEVIALTDRSWRVCDSRFPPSDPDGLLAYVERDGAGVEVLVLRHGSTETIRTDCLAAALSAISSRCSRAETAQGGRP